MFLSAITLQQFRNYSKHTVDFSSNTTVIVGQNGIGKTNLLEAITLLATGKSFKADSEREMIHEGEELARINGKITNDKLQMTNKGDELRIDELQITNKDQKTLEVMLTTGVVQGVKAPLKNYTVDGASKRLIDFAGQLRVVLFWPQDLELVTGSPSKRRKYLDTVLFQIDREYRHTLVEYEQGVRNRNKVLERIREGEASRNELFYWDQLLISHGSYVTGKRKELIEFIQKQVQLEENLQLDITYDHSIISSERLAQYKHEEVAAGTTLVGPHRDDFIVKFKVQKSKIKDKAVDSNEKNLRIYGSRGQQRLGVLWLKLAELDFIELKIGERPMLLLDDIFSELDEGHRSLVINVIGKQQTVITTTDEELIQLPKKDIHIIRL